MNHTLTLSTEQLNFILGALGELPAKSSMSLIMEIQKQAQATAQEPQPQPEPEDTSDEE
jgi:hypothetical protein